LLETETALWKTLLAIASGANAQDQLDVFLKTYEELLGDKEVENHTKRWYETSKLLMYKLAFHITTSISTRHSFLCR
jgi:hypothetical protein